MRLERGINKYNGRLTAEGLELSLVSVRFPSVTLPHSRPSRLAIRLTVFLSLSLPPTFRDPSKNV